MKSCFALAALIAALPPISPASVPFAELAASYAKSRGVDPSAKDLTFSTVVEQHYAAADLGLVALHYPLADVGDHVRVKELQDVTLALIDLELQWCSWTNVEGEAAASARKDLTELRKAVATVHLPTNADATAHDVFLLLGLKADAVALEKRVAEKLRAGDALGFKPLGSAPTQIVCEPSRKEFVELACYLGSTDETAKGYFWVDGIVNWNDLFWNEFQVLPLQYAGNKAGEDYKQGRAMNEREANGMQQFIAQRGAHALCAAAYGANFDPVFESELALDIVVDLYGANNSRTESSTRGNTTQAREVFIRGGASTGGYLGRNSADSVWRANLGADHFVKALRDAQKAAAKDSPANASKIAGFQLTSDDTTKHASVHAPFFGAATKVEMPPNEYLQDFGEFFRAYKACFLHWLHTEASSKGKKASETAFAALLKKLGEPGAEFDASVAAAVGVPLSGPDEKPDNLEWRFLAWLSKQR